MTTAGRPNCQPDEIAGPKKLVYLTLLDLSPGDLCALQRQGSVAREMRRSGDCYYKLRFRRGSRQIVIGLGKDLSLADAIRRDLAQLQAERQMEREQRRLVRAARGLLRCAKDRLESALQAAGYHYHGREIRRRRTGEGNRSKLSQTEAVIQQGPTEDPAPCGS